jgi:hypothetical protein
MVKERRELNSKKKNFMLKIQKLKYKMKDEKKRK